MPTIYQESAYRFIIFSSDWNEPPHRHIKRDTCISKFWLDPISLSKNYGFKDHELNKIERLVIR